MKNETEFLGITYAEWKAYRRVQMDGRFNMIAQCVEAARAANLRLPVYWDIIEHYGELLKHFEGKEND